VFARKWRPQNFSEVIAQEHVTKTLRNAIEKERLGHAYLFTGPRGVGKTTTARILAKALNCIKGPTPNPCMQCEACRRIAAGSHLDVLEIDGASNRGIDEIRDLREKARYAAAEGGYKIYIIDEVHMLTREAFNALLKILEEPPDKVIFIFATTEPRKVPATILSRCQRFDFRRIPSSIMAEYIREEAGKEKISIDSDALSLVCRASGGSMRDALSIMDQLVSFSGREIKGEAVSRLLGLVEADLLAEISSAVLHSRGSVALDLVQDALVRGYSIEELIAALVGFLRNLLLSAAGAEKGITDLSDSEIALLRQTVAGVSDVHVLNVLRLVAGASSQIRSGASPRISLEAALITASKLGVAFGIESLPPVTEQVAVVAVKGSQKSSDTSSGTVVSDKTENTDDNETPTEIPVAAEPSVNRKKDTAGDTHSDDEKERENSYVRKISGLFDMIPENR
jgi:DNA polymerase-3 subunit gamma/tau